MWFDIETSCVALASLRGSFRWNVRRQQGRIRWERCTCFTHARTVWCMTPLECTTCTSQWNAQLFAFSFFLCRHKQYLFILFHNEFFTNAILSKTVFAYTYCHFLLCLKCASRKVTSVSLSFNDIYILNIYSVYEVSVSNLDIELANTYIFY